MEIHDEHISSPELKDDVDVNQHTFTPWTKRTVSAVESSSRTSRLHKTQKDPNDNFVKEEDKCIGKQLHYSVRGVVLGNRERYNHKNCPAKDRLRGEYRSSRKGIARNKFPSDVDRSQTSKVRNNLIIQRSGRNLQNSETMCKNFLKKLSLEWKPVEDMVTSQYRRECAVYPVYRCLVAGYFTLVVISTAVVNNDDKIYIWFTYWALYTLTLSSILRAYTAWCYNLYWKDDDGILYCKWMPAVIKFQWILFNISSTITTIICIIFWVSVYDPEIGPTVVSINTHGINLILIVLDSFISHQPVRFLHFLYSTLFCVGYAIFTLVYWAEGGTNFNNEPFIYAILDYSDNPVRAAIYVCMVPLVAAPLCHSLYYFLYRLRTRSYRHCCLKTTKPRSQLDSTKDEKMLVMEAVSTV